MGLKSRRFLDKLEENSTLKCLVTVILSLLTGLGLALASVLITKQGGQETLEWIMSHLPVIIATALLLGLFVMLFTWLTRSLFASVLFVGILVLAASFVNYFKMLITSTPFYLSDIGLIGKAADIAKLNSSSISFSCISILAIAALLIWLALIFLISRRLRLKWKQSLLAALAVLLATGVIFGVKSVADKLIFRPALAELGSNYSQTYVYDNVGIPLGLWRSALEVMYTEPLDESDMHQVLEAAQDIVDKIDAGGSDVKPNVIFVLSESFSDITKLPGISYKEDPVEDFHRAQASGVSGSFYTRTLGYGTCNIELEILTGINTRFLSADEQLCYMPPETFDDFRPVPEVFAEEGYYTAFLHTFNDKIYNRTPIYENLGFEDLYFSGDFAEIDDDAKAAGDYWQYMAGKISGEFYSDDYMAELLIKLYEKRAEESPVFLYAVTMENHTPYGADKYGSYDYGFDADLDKSARGCLNAYTQGCANSSKALGKLVDYFSGISEPTVIVFFGDHRPGLPLEGKATLYSALGMCSENTGAWSAETFAELYSTDYVIWANDESLLPADAGSVLDTSSAYLGLDTMRIAGIKLDPYWRMIASVKESCTAYEWFYSVDSSGRIFSGLPDSCDPEEFEVMSWLMRQALHGSSDMAFYKLND